MEKIIDNLDEAGLGAAAAGGSSAALEALIRQLNPSLLRVARSIVGDHRAEDVTQEAWINIYRGLSSFDGRSRLKTWAIRITINQAYSQLRRDRRHIAEDVEVSSDAFDERGYWRTSIEPWHDDTPEALLASHQLEQKLREGLAALPETQRLAVTLRDLEGLDMDEICNILEVSASNARVLLHRGRARIREIIDAFQAGL